MVIVHHHCLHGSDARRSIAPFEQTSEEKKDSKAGEGVGYYRRTERGEESEGIKGGLLMLMGSLPTD